jgi:putative chitobiose transport system substrate-binding protein
VANTHTDTLGLSRRRVLVLGAAGGLLGAMGNGTAASGAAGPAEIHFWTLALSPWFDGYIRGQLAAFEAAHPGVKVVWSDVPYDAMERKLIASAAAGRAPDVVNMSDMNFARFVSLGAFRDLGDELPGDARDVYLESALSLCTFENFRGGGRTALLGLPWYVNTQVLLANRALLARGFGTDIATRLSTDWTGLIAMAREFRQRAGVFLFSQPLGEESELLQMLLAQGLPPLREDAERGLAADLTRPEIAAYLQLWVDLYRDGGLPREAATKGHAHLTEMFQEGRLALANTGPNFLKRIRDAAPDVYESDDGASRDDRTARTRAHPGDGAGINGAEPPSPGGCGAGVVDDQRRSAAGVLQERDDPPQREGGSG